MKNASLIYSGVGDSVVTRVDWRELSEAQRDAVLAEVRRVHGARAGVGMDGERVTIMSGGDTVEGYLSRRALAVVRS